MKKQTIQALNRAIDQLLIAGKWDTARCKKLRKLHRILTTTYAVYVQL